MTQTYYRQVGLEKWHLPCDSIAADSAAAGLIFLTKCGRNMLCRAKNEMQAEVTTTPPPGEVCRRCEKERKRE